MDGDPQTLQSPRFPRASAYNPAWVLAGVSGGANPLWLAEWLTEAVDLRPGMRVLDLACGRGLSSVFLRREFGVHVVAADLWFDPGERQRRFEAAGVADDVFAVHAEARALPFATESFDAVISIDAFPYFGTDDLYLGYLAGFVKPGGVIAIAGSGLMDELEAVPSHLEAWWEPAAWCLHSAGWWRRHWARTGIVDVELADAMPDGWQVWLDWQRAVAPDNRPEIEALEADQGRNLGYVRVVGRRRLDAPIHEPITSIPVEYVRQPLLRGG